MPFVYIENDEVVSVLNYKADIPSSIKEIEITPSEYEGLFDETFIFDVATKKVIQNPSSSNKVISQKDAELRDFLRRSDWKILRHIREKNLGLETTLTNQEYIDLEWQRHAAAQKIDTMLE